MSDKTIKKEVFDYLEKNAGSLVTEFLGDNIEELIKEYMDKNLDDKFKKYLKDHLQEFKKNIQDLEEEEMKNLKPLKAEKKDTKSKSKSKKNEDEEEEEEPEPKRTKVDKKKKSKAKSDSSDEDDNEDEEEEEDDDDEKKVEKVSKSVSKLSINEKAPKYNLFLQTYKKGLILHGEDTVKIKENLKELGGKWNKTLKGWIFTKKDEEALIQGLADINYKGIKVNGEYKVEDDD